MRTRATVYRSTSTIHLSQGLLQVVPDASEEELNTFIDFAVELGDGEAMTAAIALHRGYSVVTDDRVALRVIGDRAPMLPSLQLIKEWIEREQISREIAREALRNLRQRGSYLPGRKHPLRTWWDELFEPPDES